MDNEESERKNAEGISDDDLYGVCGGAENLFDVPCYTEPGNIDYIQKERERGQCTIKPFDPGVECRIKPVSGGNAFLPLEPDFNFQRESYNIERKRTDITAPRNK